MINFIKYIHKLTFLQLVLLAMLDIYLHFIKIFIWYLACDVINIIFLFVLIHVKKYENKCRPTNTNGCNNEGMLSSNLTSNKF